MGLLTTQLSIVFSYHMGLPGTGSPSPVPYVPSRLLPVHFRSSQKAFSVYNSGFAKRPVGAYADADMRPILIRSCLVAVYVLVLLEVGMVLGAVT